MATLKLLKLARQDLERKTETAKGQLLDAIGAETLRVHSERLDVALDKLVNLSEAILYNDCVTSQEEDPMKMVSCATTNLTQNEGVATGGSSSDDVFTVGVLREELEHVESSLKKADDVIFVN